MRLWGARSMKAALFYGIGYTATVAALVLGCPLLVLWAMRQLGGTWVQYTWGQVLAIDVVYVACWLLLTHVLQANEIRKLSIATKGFARVVAAFKKNKETKP